MKDRMQEFSQEELECIHNASMDILKNSGVNFNSEKAATLFAEHGFKTEGNVVFFLEEDIKKAAQSAPSRFTIEARNPEKNVAIGEDDFVCLSTGGAPNIMLPSGNQRSASMDDFLNCCKLVQTSDQLNLGGYLMVQPNDIPVETGHLDMVSQYIQMCDKPILGASNSGEAALDSIKMAAMVFDRDKEELKKQPVLLAIVNAMSPLQFSEEQTDVIMTMADYCQPVVVTNMMLAGSTGPISLPGLLALGNAELLAGVVLTQLVNPGSPVVYGSTSGPMDMKTTVGTVGAPETIKIANGVIHMARYYNIPSRAGGMLTDSHYPDAQALAEGSMLMSTVVRNGANFIFHSCGQLGSYIAMSFEKWLIDEEVLRNIRLMISPMEITPETIDVDFLKEVGVGGQYLTHMKTFTQFKSLSQPISFNRASYDRWSKEGSRFIDEVVQDALQKRLEGYQVPEINKEIVESLNDFVAAKKLERTETV